MHTKQVTVYCEFWAVSVISPYFFKIDIGQAITFKGKRYIPMITNFFWPELNDLNTNDMNGTRSHTAHATLDILHASFEDLAISSGGDVNTTVFKISINHVKSP